ncbi:hypothetical protein DBV15_12400 [Temnothorax longispinosus]|uniref:Uncharacterized protein n=1 Tax=Temnothorax longispinosus TaxID=300112 RepID=A0A4S2LBB2_9HYME|nr:hypothetical protein DBV15_12400 [Temnothorax longispinosus]
MRLHATEGAFRSGLPAASLYLSRVSFRGADLAVSAFASGRVTWMPLAKPGMPPQWRRVRKRFSRGGEAREDEVGWWSMWRRIGGGRESGGEVEDSVIEEQQEKKDVKQEDKGPRLHDEGAERVGSMEFRASDRSTCRETEECDGGAAGAERSGESSRRVEGSSNRTSGLAARGGRLSKKFGCGRENKTRRKAVERIVEEKVRKMLRERKEDDRKKDEKMEELEEKVRSFERKIERIEQRGGKRKREEYEESGTEKKK